MALTGIIFHSSKTLGANVWNIIWLSWTVKLGWNRVEREKKNCDFLSHSEFRWFKLSQTVGLSKLFWWFWLFFLFNKILDSFSPSFVCTKKPALVYTCECSVCCFFYNKFEIDWYVKSNNSRKNFDYFMCDLPAVVEFSPNFSLCLWVLWFVCWPLPGSSSFFIWTCKNIKQHFQ